MSSFELVGFPTVVCLAPKYKFATDLETHSKWYFGSFGFPQRIFEIYYVIYFFQPPGGMSFAAEIYNKNV